MVHPKRDETCVKDMHIAILEVQPLALPGKPCRCCSVRELVESFRNDDLTALGTPVLASVSLPFAWNWKGHHFRVVLELRNISRVQTRST